MKLQLREIFQVTGMHLPVSYSIPLSELEDVHGYTFAEPIAVEGEFVNRAGIVTLNYQVSCRLDAVCDRCLKPFTPSFSYTFSHTVVPSLHSDNPAYDAYLVAENDKIDLNETAISDLLLMLPTKLLCREVSGAIAVSQASWGCAPALPNRIRVVSLEESYSSLADSEAILPNFDITKHRMES